MLTPFIALIRKDLRLFLMDRRAVLMSVVVPIAIASFFGYVFGGGAGNGDSSRIPVMVTDLDGSAYSRGIVSELQADKALEVKTAAADAAAASVRNGKTTAALVIPKKFFEDMVTALLANGKRPEIGIVYDPSHAMEMRMVQGIVAGAAMESAGKHIFRGGNTTQPFNITAQEATAKPGDKYNGYGHSFGGMGIQFLLMIGVDVGIGLILRRQQGVWKRMRAAPLSRGVMLGSRATSSAITSMATWIVLFTFARVVFGVRIEGSFLGFVCVCAAFSLMTASFGLMVAALGKTAEATRGLAVLVTLLLVMLGGAWVPTFVFPRWLQAITVVIPTRWAMDGLDNVVWRGLGFGSVALPIALMMATTLACYAVAVMRFRWED
jgi:ABC-2 type transport system permease protein